MSVPYDKGYWNRLPKKEPTPQDATAWLLDTEGNRMDLWLHDITSDFEMAGKFAQSAQVREWYPHNFVQTRFTLIGQSPNQYHYNKLCEFVRGAQLAAVGNTNKNRMALWIPQGRLPTKEHMPYHFQGYVEAMERKNERFVNAPEFTIQFVVAYANSALYKQDTVHMKAIKDWTTIFEGGNSAGITTVDPDDIIGPQVPGRDYVNGRPVPGTGTIPDSGGYQGF